MQLLWCPESSQFHFQLEVVPGDIFLRTWVSPVCCCLHSPIVALHHTDLGKLIIINYEIGGQALCPGWVRKMCGELGDRRAKCARRNTVFLEGCSFRLYNPSSFCISCRVGKWRDFAVPRTTRLPHALPSLAFWRCRLFTWLKSTGLISVHLPVYHVQPPRVR